MAHLRSTELDSYSPSQQTLIRGAAEALKTTPDVLIAAVSAARSNASTESNEVDSQFGSEPTVADFRIEASAISLPPQPPSELHAIEQRGAVQTVCGNTPVEQWDNRQSFPSFQPDDRLNTTQMLAENERLMTSFSTNLDYSFAFSHDAHIPMDPVWPPYNSNQPENSSMAMCESADTNHQMEPSAIHQEELLLPGNQMQAHQPPAAMPPSAQLFPASGTQNPETQADYINEGVRPFAQQPSPKKRGRQPYQDPAKRRQTGLTRKYGACIPCSLQRIRCVPDPRNPHACCKTCMEKAKTRVHYTPCWRYKISEAMLLDHAICPRASWTLRWKKMEMVDIRNWASTTIKKVTITQGIFDNKYDLKVRRFIPQEGDAMERKWTTNGVDQSFKCEPYAIADMREAGHTLAQFAKDSLKSSIRFYIGETDNLLSRTYSMARRYSSVAEREEERLLLLAALRLWCASRMESRSDYICSKETLGMRPRRYNPESINDGKVLLPPVLSAQMEVIVTVMILRPAQREVLQRLRKLMEENKRHHWFTIYLCIFMLLHSCALLTIGDNKKARKQGLDPKKHRFLRPSVIEELHNGARTILAWFHNLNRGSRPFSLDWESPNQVARSELNPEQCQFMKVTVDELKNMAAHFQRIQQEKALEDEYYFVAQLYDPDWKPTHTV